MFKQKMEKSLEDSFPIRGGSNGKLKNIFENAKKPLAGLELVYS